MLSSTEGRSSQRLPVTWLKEFMARCSASLRHKDPPDWDRKVVHYENIELNYYCNYIYLYIYILVDELDETGWYGWWTWTQPMARDLVHVYVHIHWETAFNKQLVVDSLVFNSRSVWICADGNPKLFKWTILLKQPDQLGIQQLVMSLKMFTTVVASHWSVLGFASLSTWTCQSCRLNKNLRSVSWISWIQLFWKKANLISWVCIYFLLCVRYVFLISWTSQTREVF